MIVSCVMIAPLGWAIKDNIYNKEVSSFLITILTGFVLSFIVLKSFPIKKEDYEKVNAKDGLAIVGLSWIFLSLFGAMPLFLTGVVPTYTDAFFETVSGFTTTGATVIQNIESLPKGILFWRSLTHWLGGMGIIVLCLALLPALGQNAYRLYKAESPGITVERIEPGNIKETAKILWGVYFFLSFLETILLMAGGMPLFDALCHTFGTMATGGFSTKSASIAAYGPYIQWVIIIFMFLAGANFMLHYQALRGKLNAYFKNEEFRYYFMLIFFMIIIVAVVLYKQGGITDPIRTAAFQVVSITTTTGYVTADFDLWPNAVRFGLVCLMFIGGCGGSTGGGMKVVRIFLSIKVGLRAIVQMVYPNAILPIKFNSTKCNDRLVVSVLSYFVIFIFLFFFGAILMTITEKCDIVTAITASIATLSNIGPGLGKVGAVQNYAWISIPGKWILTFLMLAGRLELYSILVLLVPSTWKK